MSAIGGITVFSLPGADPIQAARKVRDVTRPGTDGIGLAQIGTKGVPFQQQAILHDLAANVAGKSNSFFALEGTTVSFTNDRGTTYSNYIIRHIEKPRVLPMGISVGGVPSATPDYQITYTFQLTYVGT